MKKCFVIQPFDGSKFDLRYRDTFKPAIIEAGFEPYRVDEDEKVKIPIEDIEKGIRDSDICFAEITLNNPNVWYELGYAFACNKDVVLVCDNNERQKYPFDIQHGQIINYKTNSSSDFEKLKKDITKKLIAFSKIENKIEKLISNPVKGSEGFKPHELTLMIIMMTEQITDFDSVPIFSLKNNMEKAGFSDAAVSLAIRSLRRHEMIEIIKDVDYNGREYYAGKLTQKGEDWILKNENKIELKIKDVSEDNEFPEFTSDNLPF